MTAVEKMHFVAPAVSTLGLAPCVQGAPDSHTHGRTVAWTREMNKYFSPIYEGFIGLSLVKTASVCAKT